MTESQFHITHDVDTGQTFYVLFLETSDASFEVRFTPLEMGAHYRQLHAFLTKDTPKKENSDD